jgi:hypothetical protein
MRLCILCEDSKVELARENSKVILTSIENKPTLHPILQTYKETLPKGHLSIPVSKTGELPVTHWFCFLNVDQKGYEQLLSIQEHSVIEEGSPKEFLSKWNLKIIK